VALPGSRVCVFVVFFFFFQAEDGIRDATVTGVQTCALPISFMAVLNVTATFSTAMNAATITTATFSLRAAGAAANVPATVTLDEIGRASCRERGEMSVVSGVAEKPDD